MGWEDDDNLTAFIDIFGPSCPEIKSATFKAPNHTRTIIGIGEEVRISVKNRCGSTVDWTLTGGGTILAQGSSELEFQAGWEASTITLTATLININSECSSCQTSFTIDYDVILPNKIVYERVNTPITNEVGMHVQNYVSGGYFAAKYILPDNVNFYNCRISEEDCLPYQNDGDYHDLPPATPDMYHNASPDKVEMTDQVYPGKGTLCEMNDLIWFIFWCRGQKNPKYSGEYNYQIKQFVHDMNINQPSYFKFDEAFQKSKNIGGQEIQIGGQLIPVNSELQVDKHSIQDGPTGSRPNIFTSYISKSSYMSISRFSFFFILLSILLSGCFSPKKTSIKKTSDCNSVIYDSLGYYLNEYVLLSKNPKRIIDSTNVRFLKGEESPTFINYSIPQVSINKIIITSIDQSIECRITAFQLLIYITMKSRDIVFDIALFL